MDILQDLQPEHVLLALLALAAGWFLLRVLLRFTVRLFACGFLVLALVAIGWILYSTLA